MTERRLTAILFSDIKGFSARMGADEAGTFALLRVHNAILDGAIAAHGGRVVKTVGDAYMAEFASSVAAVGCALDVQRRLAEHNRAAAPGEQIHVRIGVHAGDVMVEGGDLFGEAVNLAARLEPIAPVDGVCVSAAVFGQVRRKVNGRAEPMGLRQLKNLPEPVELFALRPGDAPLDVPDLPVASAPRRQRRWGVPVATAAVALALAAAWWTLPHTRTGGTVRVGYHGALDGASRTEPFDGFSRRIARTTQEGLVHTAGDGTVVGGPVRVDVASPTRLELSLRDDVWFHPHPCLGADGRKATPDDVAWSIRHAVEGGVDLGISGTEELRAHGGQLAGVRQEGPIVAVDLDRPNVYALDYLESVTLLPVELETCDAGPTPPGTGPFRADVGATSGVVTLSAEPRFRRDVVPRLDGVVWSPVASPRDGSLAVEKGELDLYFLPTDAMVELVDTTGSRPVLRAPVPGVEVGVIADEQPQLLLHVMSVRPGRVAALEDQRVRQAFAWAIDRAALSAAPTCGAPRGRLLTPQVLGYHATLTGWSHDPARAAALLAEAGFPAGNGLPELILGTGPGREAEGALVAGDLAAIGVHTRQVTLSNREARLSLTSDPVDLFLGVMGVPVFGTEPIGITGVSERLGRWAPALAPLAQAVRESTTPDDRSERYAALEAAIVDAAFDIPLADLRAGTPEGKVVLYGPRVSGWFDATGVWAGGDWAAVHLDR